MFFLSLQFSLPLGYALAALALVAGLLVCMGLAWRRDPRTRGLEALRAACVVAALLTLCQPTWVKPVQPDARPEVMVLADHSGSMETKDLPGHDSPRPRSAGLIEAEAHSVWRDLGGEFDVRWQPFASEGRGTDIAAAMESALRSARRPKALVLFSDGDWNLGSNPSQAASQWRARGLPIFTVPLGQASRLPDLALIDPRAPSIAVLGEPTRLSFRGRNSLTVPFQGKAILREGEQILGETELSIQPSATADGVILWTPKNPGQVSLRLELPVPPGDSRPENNQASLGIEVREQKLRVLLVERLPRWEFRFLRNALTRDPSVELHSLLLHPELGASRGEGYLERFPSSVAELAHYDVVFLGDIGIGQNELTELDATNLRGLVEKQSGGLIFLPGRAGRQLSFLGSPLEELLPVVLDSTRPKGQGQESTFALELTSLGRSSVLTMLADSPQESAKVWRSFSSFSWNAPVIRAAAGATVLAVHESTTGPSGRLPLIVAKAFGRGKTLFLGTDGIWRWRRGVEDRYHYRFWAQVARWMAYQRKMSEGQRVRLFHSPDPPRAGASVFFTAHLSGTDNAPLQGASAKLLVTRPDGGKQTIPLQEEPGSWGVYTGTWLPDAGGEFSVGIEAPGLEDRHTTKLSVVPATIEALGEAARPEVMDEIAQVGGGQLISLERLADLSALIHALPTEERAVIRTEIWRHPLWVALVTILLAAFWILRKRAGLT